MHKQSLIMDLIVDEHKKRQQQIQEKEQRIQLEIPEYHHIKKEEEVNSPEPKRVIIIDI